MIIETRFKKFKRKFKSAMNRLEQSLTTYILS